MAEYHVPMECPGCRSDKVVRDYVRDEVNFIPPQHTLGALADRNSSRMSDDHKLDLYRQHNDYKKGTDNAT